MIDIEKYKNQKLTVRIDDEKDEMSYFEFSRWLSLLEGVELVGKKSSQMGLDNKDKSWIKPIAFQKYIDERYKSMLYEIAES
jgi:hypothetical protein